MHDDELLQNFESLTLPFDQWTHRNHVRVAYLYLSKHPFNEALLRLRTNIKRYNHHNNRPESPTQGYNETTTHAFAHLIAAVMRAYAHTFPVANSDEFCDTHPQFMSKHVLRFFYSPERRMHPDAKQTFIEPDLAPLPTIQEA